MKHGLPAHSLPPSPIVKKSRAGATDTANISFRRASLLDVPLIFDLMSAGALTGVFSDAFVQRTGCVKLLGMILQSMACQYLPFNKASDYYTWQIISSATGEDVGFAKVAKGVGPNGDTHLQLLAVCPQHRNHGIGTAVLERVQGEVPNGAQLVVHCNKYARAMQHILKRHRLKRNVRFGVPQLEEYRSRWGALSVR